jgi:hypothetical protein
VQVELPAIQDQLLALVVQTVCLALLLQLVVVEAEL